MKKEIMPVTVRFPKVLIESIKKMAEEENRSLNNMVIELLKRGVKNEKTTNSI
ncbi:MAG: Arc family DNA-binding protein [Cetobacterium sp.]